MLSETKHTIEHQPSKLGPASSPIGEDRVSPFFSAPEFSGKPQKLDSHPKSTLSCLRYFSREVAFPIILSKGKVAWVDAADYGRVIQHKWSYTKGQRGNEYAVRWVNGTSQYLHRFILRPEAGRVVDHVDGNGLNCIRSNMRICTQRQNCWNRTAPKRLVAPAGLEPAAPVLEGPCSIQMSYGAISKYTGVRHRHGKWQARIRENKKTHVLGHFPSEEAAARAYDAKAKELHGEFARLNFPDSTQECPACA